MKTFLEYIESRFNESVTFSIQDYKPQNPVKGLYDLSVEINNQLMRSFGEAYRTGDMKNIYDKFTIDGNTYMDAQEGTLNFYSGGMEESVVKKCLEAIKYFLGNYGAKLTGPIKKEQSNIYKMDVYRFPVSVKNDEDIAPELNVANYAAEKIVVDMLQMHPEEAFIGSIHVNDLLLKLGTLSDFAFQQMQSEPTVERPKKGPIAYDAGFDAERLQRYIDVLTQMAQWAKENGYDYIHWA